MALYPQHPRPSCHAVIVNHQQEVLLVRRGGEPFRDWWGLPGGAVELGETVGEALIREVMEETGLEISVGPLLHFKDAISHDGDAIKFHYVILFFQAWLLGGTVRPSSDASDARWVSWEALQEFPLVPGAMEVIGAAEPFRARGCR